MSSGDILKLACPRQLPIGRSKILVGTALAFAVAALDRVQDKHEAAASDRNDMVALFLYNSRTRRFGRC